MKHLFSIDNKFFGVMTRIADLLILNFLFLICCLPLITIGASTSALYSVTLKMSRNEEPYIFKGFLKAFKENFKCSTIVWIIFLFIGLILSADFFFTNIISSNELSNVLRILITGLAIIEFIMFSYAFPIIAKFYNTTGNYLKNSFLMAICHLPFTLGIFAINAIPIACFLVGSYVIAFGTVFYMFIGFSLSAFINSFLFNKVFENYIEETPPHVHSVE